MKLDHLSLCVLAGLAWGISCATFLLPLGMIFSLTALGLTAAVIGAVSLDRRSGTSHGALFGFLVTYTFMVASYGGPTDSMMLFRAALLFFPLISVFGALCGAIFGFTGALSRKRP